MVEVYLYEMGKNHAVNLSAARNMLRNQNYCAKQYVDKSNTSQEA